MRAYDSYSNPVERADISRYAVLFLHGGVYLDLDVRCERSLDAPELALLEKPIVLPRTWPVGISNDVIVAAPGNGLLELALRSAATAKKITSVLLFPSGYGKVMFSTGPMFLTITALRWPGRGEKLWIMPARLYGKYREKRGRRAARGATATAAAAAASSSTAAGCQGENENGGSNRLHGAGAAYGALFTHLHGSSWHGKDAALLAWVRGKGEAGSDGGGGAAAAAGVSAAAAAGVAAVVVARARAKRQKEKQKEKKQQQLLQMQQRRLPVSQQQQQQHPLFGKKRPPLVPAAMPSVSKQL